MLLSPIDLIGCLIGSAISALLICCLATFGDRVMNGRSWLVLGFVTFIGIFLLSGMFVLDFHSLDRSKVLIEQLRADLHETKAFFEALEALTENPTFNQP